ncbi:zinc finger protein 155-like isoform X5 [Myxocyprinus asiaticus]|uniref:zinc finger protein 155-like isoform X5 n=1 Tax=Myxocyprinus asiaticus TaxID=70543 RepID=UPI00222258F9|nr:zinc finger protein 155-like isoform X5 [Myxocyprinus asiaticus]
MSKSFQLQLSSIMEIMTKTAMEEICKLVNRDFAFLQQELSRVMSENTVLKDKMFCLESEVESTRITKLEPRAGSKIYRSICVQTEYGVQPSIKRIFGKEWCSSLWDRRIERREDKLAIDVDQHMGQDCSNQLFIKEENLEVDTYTSYTGPGPSEARDDGSSQKIYGYDVTTAESCEKRFKVQKLPGRPKLSYCDSGKMFLHQNATKNRLRRYKCRPPVKFQKVKPKKKFRCEVCGKCFHSNTNLTVHYVVHTGERPHKCSYCGKGFSQKGNLHTHERIHRGERPFTCQICGKGFTQKVCLRNHERIHSGERPYTCVTCGRGFTQEITLDQHMIVHQRRAKIKAKRTLSDLIYSFI